MTRTRKRRAAGTSARQRAWNASPRMRDIRLQASQKAAAERDDAPKCGAKRKGDGAPCQNPGLENGRCRLHGGLTPKGANWHKVRWPAHGAPIAKLEKKQRELERRRQQQAARVAAMSPERRAKYEARRRAMLPGGKTRREAAKRDREARQAFAATERHPKTTSPEAAALAAEIEALKARQRELRDLLEEGNGNE